MRRTTRPGMGVRRSPKRTRHATLARRRRLTTATRRARQPRASPMVWHPDAPPRLAFPWRRGLVWRRLVSELRTEAGQELLPGIASLFNGALFRASTFESMGVPDLRLFVRGDERGMHRR